MMYKVLRKRVYIRNNWMFRLDYRMSNGLTGTENLIVYDRRNPFPVEIARQTSQNFVLDLYKKGAHVEEAILFSVLECQDEFVFDVKLVEECTIVRAK